MPLKVIKGRLENGMTDPEAPTPHLFEMGDPPPEREAQPVLVGAVATRRGRLERGPRRHRHAHAHGRGVLARGRRAPLRPLGLGRRRARPCPTPARRAAGTTGDAPTEAKPPSQGKRRRPGARPRAESSEPATATAASSRRRRPAGARETRARAIEAPPEASEAEPTGCWRLRRAGSTAEAAGLCSPPPVALDRRAARRGALRGEPDPRRSWPARAASRSPASRSSRASASSPAVPWPGCTATARTPSSSPSSPPALPLTASRPGTSRSSSTPRTARPGSSPKSSRRFCASATPRLVPAPSRSLTELAELGEALMRCFSQATLRELTGG